MPESVPLGSNSTRSTTNKVLCLCYGRVRIEPLNQWYHVICLDTEQMPSLFLPCCGSRYGMFQLCFNWNNRCIIVIVPLTWAGSNPTVQFLLQCEVCRFVGDAS